MAILGLNKLFNKKKSISDIGIDELRKEKIRLEQEEARYMRKVDDLEKQKKELLIRGVAEGSDRQKRALALKIKEIDVEARNKDRNLQFFSKQQRIINGFLQIKENEKILQQAGVLSLVNQLDLQSLQTYVEQASMEGAFHLDKFESIIGTIEDGDRVTSPMRDEEDIEEIMKLMDDMKRAEMEDPNAVETMASDGLNRILRVEKEEDLY
jgi:hypothetical protein